MTGLLKAWSGGDRAALDQLIPLVHTELRHIADRLFVREHVNHTLQPTALVNELYLQFTGREDLQWQDRVHFFALAASEMRRILIAHARKKRAAKRGHGATHIAVDQDELAGESGGRLVDLLALDAALTRLEALDAESCRIVELRYFAGLSVPDVAEALRVTERTVFRRWAWAKAWLYDQLDTTGVHHSV